MSHPARAANLGSSKTSRDRPEAIPSVIAAYIEAYRQAFIAAAHAERHAHDLAKAAALLKADMCKPD